MSLISYTAALKKVEDGEMSIEDMQVMKERGLIGPSPDEQRILQFPESERPIVRQAFDIVAKYNAVAESGKRLRIQVLQPKHEPQTAYEAKGDQQ